MKNNKLIVALGVVAGIIILWLLIENSNKDEKIAELQKEIDENENINEEIKKRLTELIQNNHEIAPQIANELGQIAALLGIKQDTTAVFKLAKIIESLLKQLYKGSDKLKEVAKKHGRKTPVFNDYLEHAKDEKVITTEDWHLLSVMKIIRNEEAHEVDVKKERTRLLASFISGMGIILGLCRMLKKKTIEAEVLA